VKDWISTIPIPYADLVGDFVLYQLNDLFPEILPKRVMYLGRANDHHIMITVGEFDDDDDEEEEKSSSSTTVISDNKTTKTSFHKDNSLSRFEKRLNQFLQNHKNVTKYTCQTKSEEDAMQAFRFVAAPAFRTWCVGTGSQGISIDYALPRNDGRIPPILLCPLTSSSSKDEENNKMILPLKRMRYSHFGCNVVHEDIAYEKGVNVHEEKK